MDRSMVRAVVRTIADIADIQREIGSEPEAKIVTAPFAGDLRIACVIARPTTMRFLKQIDLADLGLTPDEAIALGIRNVAADLKPLPEVMMGVPGEATARSDGDDYESGRVMLHDDLAELSGSWGDRLVVAVPGTHVVLYADGRRKDAIPAMRGAIREIMTRAERPISATLFHWTKTGWEVIPPQRLTIPPARTAGSTARRRRASGCGPPGRRRGRRRPRRASRPPCGAGRAISRPPS
jgi:hypothetical protein